MRIAGAVLLVVLWAGGAEAQMYKCVDERGVTHYADKPTPGCRNAAVDIQGSPPMAGRTAPPASSNAQQEADFRRRLLEREEAERVGQARRAELERRCANLRAERGRLGSGRRLVEIDPQGERVYVEDGVRERRLADVQAALQGCP